MTYQGSEVVDISEAFGYGARPVDGRRAYRVTVRSRGFGATDVMVIGHLSRHGRLEAAQVLHSELFGHLYKYVEADPSDWRHVEAVKALRRYASETDGIIELVLVGVADCVLAS